MTKLTALFLVSFTTTALALEPVLFTINTKKWSHVLDDHFISITVNPTDILQGKVYGLQMNSTMAILKGLAPAYVRIGSADTAKYTFKRNRYPSDVVKPDDEYTVTETHWIVFNEVAQQAGLDVIVCLNAAHRSEGTKKWDTRNSLELISFSDSQGYNLTWQLGYEVQAGDDLSGLQFGKDLNRLRTILNAFPRYQQSKLIGPDIRVIHKKEDIDFWNDMLFEAAPILDAITWHPRWPQPSKMKVSDNSELGYEFPVDYLEWDKAQLSKILQRSIFRNPVWIGETKRESTGTFAEGLIWARRLVLAAKLGVEVVMKQPNLMDITHPKPEYWIALLHKRLLGKSVLETKNVGNNTDLAVISHCTNPYYWSDKPEKLQDGSVTVYAVNMGGLEQKIQIRGTWTGKSQLVFQYVLTSGSDPDSVFSQMTYLNGEPLMMTDDGLLPDIIPKIKKLQRGLSMKLPPYSVGYFVVPEARVKICQIQQQNIPTINIETLTPSKSPKTLENIRDINQFIVEKLKNPESESEELTEMKIEESSESSEKDDVSNENNLPRIARRIRQTNPMDELNQQIKTIMKETQEFLAAPDTVRSVNPKSKFNKASQTMEKRVQGLAEGISDAIKHTNQEQEFNKFLEDSGLKQDFGSLIANDRRFAPGMKNFQPFLHTRNPEGRLDEFEVKERLRRSISESEEFSQEESMEDETELRKISLEGDEENKTQKQDIVIPHQPDLKGLEEKYKQIVQTKLQDGKRKIDDIKRKMQEETPKIKPAEDIQEEIIKKEIELLEKTEETVADILKSQKKRQETFEDIIFDELNDVKGERIRELEEMHRNRENAIVKRQIQTPLSKPLMKTVEYIEKNFNLEPDSVRKIKRSLEERMGEILRNYDTKKSMEVKKRLAPYKEEKKATLKKPAKEPERKPERTETKPRREREEETRPVTKERPKEKNVIKKTSSQTHHKTTRKPTEDVQRSRKTEEKRAYEDDNDSFEMFNEKKMEEPVRRSERRRPTETPEGKKPSRKTKTVAKNEDRSSEERETRTYYEEIEEDRREVKSKKKKEIELIPEETPLKNDKDRREHMLKQITKMVDKMTSKERTDSKKTREDDDISEEFDSDRRPRGIKRKPRKAEMVEEPNRVFAKIAEKTPEIPAAEDKDTNKFSKLRKLRLRSNRKQKDGKKPLTEKEEGSQQRKRHLASIERPMMELEKKKMVKPKFRKINPKFIHGNELMTDDKPEIMEIPMEHDIIPIEQQEMLPELPEPLELEPTPSSILQANEELRKDLEEIVEEKIFLGQGSETSNDRSDKNGEESSKEKETEAEDDQMVATESYVTEEPTEDVKSEEVEMTERPEMSPMEGTTEENSEKPTEEPEIQENDKKEEEEEDKKDDSQQKNSEKEDSSIDRSVEDVVSLTQIKTLEAELDKKTSSEEGSYSSSVEDSIAEDSIEKPEEGGLLTKIDGSQRKRRATFLPNHGEEDEEDYSSEERIQKFKQMVYRKSPSRKPVKNDVRSSSGMGMGADEFLRMAGSTVRVMFDDVIPEAYGQTKNKIQNMGISEYIKEFGNIVQQMKNLDQIFLNIGEAAVKGYIRGNKAEKGPYIQVISRKKRGTEGEDRKDESAAIEESLENIRGTQPDVGSSEYAKPATGEEIYRRRDDREDNRDASTSGRESGESIHEDDKTRSVETPDSAQEKVETAELQQMAETEERALSENPTRKGLPENPTREDLSETRTRKILPETPTRADLSENPTRKDLPENPTRKDLSATRTRKIQPENPSRTDLSENPTRKALPENPTREDQSENPTREDQSENPTREDQSENPTRKDLPEKEKVSNPNFLKEISKIKKPDRSTLHNMLKDNAVSRKVIAYVPEDLQEKIFSPWIKTTKDFIQQALTTLQRQRELSEILANDLMNRDITRKTIGKREAGDEDEEDDDEPRLPVYHMVPPRGNKKRETEEQKHSDESLIRHLRGLQPGVYVVPTEEMTNIRSEQITKEAANSGMPNVVTLNIYYDKKNADAIVKTDSAPEEPKITQDAVTYYQNKAWNAATSQYNQPNPYMTVPDISLSNPLVVNPALQTQTVFTAEPRVADLPNSRLIQYPTPTYHYPPVQKMYPGVVPNPQPVYNPVYYLPQDARYASQPPGTKRQWREFKARSSGVPVNSGWNIQYDLPASPKGVVPSSYNKNYKFVTQDKKRSIGDFKLDPSWTEAVLPFWKFFTTSEKKEKKVTEIQPDGSMENESPEDVFEENRKRAKAAEEKKMKTTSKEKIQEEEEEIVEEEEKSRKRRSITDNNHNLSKRSPYHFRDHDILPEWFGTYREIENGLENFPPHIRRSHIVSTPWTDEDEELLNILEADDELTLIDLDSDDYYYSNDNNIQHLRRYPRSTDQFESNMIKTNMIYKTDGDHLKQKALGMTGIKKLTDEDSSLETGTKSKPVEVKTTTAEPNKEKDQTTEHQSTTTERVLSTTARAPTNGSLPSQNSTSLPPRNPHDEALYYFFKYAYDSLVKMMKSMTQFF